MDDLALQIIGILFNVIVSIIIISKILHTSINIKSIKVVFYIVITGILIILNTFYITPLLKMFLTTIVLVIVCNIIFEGSFTEIMCAVLLEQIILLISEIIFMISASLVTGMGTKTLVESTIGSFFSNITISFLALLVSSSKTAKKTTRYIIDIIKTTANIKIAFISIVSVLIINFLLAASYFQVNLAILLIIASFYISFIIYMIHNIIQGTNLNIQYKAENDALINNLHEYEKMVDEHRVINHENKNQLGIIRTMVETKDETVLEYIDDLVKNNTTKDESLLSKTSRIPAGGLQGIIYQKLLTMKKEHINYALNISRDIKFLDFKKLDMGTMVEICKIIGVFLDNAIEEVENLEKTYIGIELYVEDDAFCIKVSNNYSRGRDFSKIEELGYTTKENGHGYGLFLVKEIIEKNDRLINERSVTGKYFNQIVKVLDMKLV